MGCDCISKSILDNYIEEWGSVKAGTKMVLAVDRNVIKEDVKNGYKEWNDELGEYVIEEDGFWKEWDTYETFLDQNIYTVEHLYNVGAVQFEGFDYGMEIKWFKKE